MSLMLRWINCSPLSSLRIGVAIILSSRFVESRIDWIEPYQTLLPVSVTFTKRFFEKARLETSRGLVVDFPCQRERFF